MKLKNIKVKEELEKISKILKDAHNDSFTYAQASREEISTAKGKVDLLIDLIDWEGEK